MTTIYLIRHTQAEGNLYHVMQGHWDGNITALGSRQIDALARRMKDVRIDAVYSSDLRRAVLTAGAITRYHPLDIVTDKRLREINVGPLEATAFANAIHKYPEQMENFMHRQDKWQLDGAETYEEVTQRAYEALEDIALRHDGQAVAAVSHGITIRCFAARVMGIPLSGISQLPTCTNTAVTTLEYENGKFRLIEYNNAGHLDAPETANSRLVIPRPHELRFESFDPSRSRKFYTDCYEGSWLAAHGTLRGFTPGAYLHMAAEHYARDNNSVLRVLDGDEPVGLIDMDTRRGESSGYGWLTLIYLKPEYRRRGYGIQLLGQAIIHYEMLGRKSLRLHCAEDNTAAMKFYESWGFEKLSAEDGRLGTLWLMEKKF